MKKLSFFSALLLVLFSSCSVTKKLDTNMKNNYKAKNEARIAEREAKLAAQDKPEPVRF